MPTKTASDPAPIESRMDLYTLDTVARKLSISRSRVYELVAAGDLRAVRLGRLRRIRATDFDAYVNGLQA